MADDHTKETFILENQIKNNGQWQNIMLLRLSNLTNDSSSQ